MGRAARVNPRSLEGATALDLPAFAEGKSARSVMDARLARFCDFFQTRADFDAYCERARLKPAELAYLERFLPLRLKGITE